MKIQDLKQLLWLIVLGLPLACATQSTQVSVEKPAAVPYQLQLKQLAGSDFPGLHSMIYARNNDKLLLMAGRVNGLHGFPGQSRASANPSFPADKKNETAFVIDVSTGKVLASASVTTLPSPIAQQLTASNTQFTVVNDVLYVAGGYGYDTDSKSMKTLSQVMAVSLPEFISAVEHGSLNSDFAKQSIYVGSHPALAITGGDLEYADTIGGDSFLLVFGHQFDGVYSTGGGTATQKYSESVRQFNFKLGQSGSQAGTNLGILDVELMGVYPPISRTRPVEETEQYHRRDLTVLPLLAPDGSNRIAALGGVFVPGQMAGFVNPVFITGDGSKQTQSVNLSVDTSISQLMSQYEVATVPVYSQTQKTMYTTFFAGISQYYWKDGKLNHDTPNFNISPPVDGLPFINSISTLKVDSSGSGQYLHNSETFPPATAQPSCGGTAAPYLGAETVFVAAKGVLDSNEVIQLESVSQSTVVGYLVGGIAATAPYPGDKTCASPTYYEVTLVPHKATDTTLLSMP